MFLETNKFNLVATAWTDPLLTKIKKDASFELQPAHHVETITVSPCQSMTENYQLF